jgi:hypothetical protein
VLWKMCLTYLRLRRSKQPHHFIARRGCFILVLPAGVSPWIGRRRC